MSDPWGGPPAAPARAPRRGWRLAAPAAALAVGLALGFVVGSAWAGGPPAAPATLAPTTAPAPAPETSVVVRQTASSACLETAIRADRLIHLLVRNRRREAADLLVAYTVASRQCRRDANP
jgi:hypothetical protein